MHLIPTHTTSVHQCAHVRVCVFPNRVILFFCCTVGTDKLLSKLQMCDKNEQYFYQRSLKCICIVSVSDCFFQKIIEV